MSKTIMTEGGPAQRGTERGKAMARPGDMTGAQYHKGHAAIKDDPVAYITDATARAIVTGLLERVDALEKARDHTAQTLGPSINYALWKADADQDELEAFVSWARGGYQGEFPPVETEDKPAEAASSAAPRRVRRTDEPQLASVV